MVVLDTGKCQTFGSNKYGELGTGNTQARVMPASIKHQIMATHDIHVRRVFDLCLTVLMSILVLIAFDHLDGQDIACGSNYVIALASCTKTCTCLIKPPSDKLSLVSPLKHLTGLCSFCQVSLVHCVVSNQADSVGTRYRASYACF